MSSSIPHVPNSARPALLSLVEEHLTGLIREAVMVQRHCKRARIHLPASNNDADSPEDAATTTATATATVSSGKEPAAKRRLHAEDINMALQWRGSEKIYATATVGNNSSDDKKILLEEYLKSELELRPPQEVGMTIHWLAVDGIQPDIPQNPPPLPGSSQADDSNEVHRVEPEDEAMDAQGSSSEGVQVTQLLPRLLSEELQLYFSRVTTAIERGGANPTTRQQQDAALASVAQDSGLQELVPFLVNYVSKALYCHVGSPDHCRTLVRMARALLHNPHLHLELHLHQLLPALLTCVVAERLSSKPGENHWMLRQEAAMALVQACNLFGDDYATLKARVLRTLCDAAGPDRCLPTQYGGFVAISLFGPRAINAFLLPLALRYWKTWETTLDATRDLGKRFELQMCQQAVLDALGVFLSNTDESELPRNNLLTRWQELEDTFGDRLVMLVRDDAEYAHCIL